jgi:hypothetical protein
LLSVSRLSPSSTPKGCDVDEGLDAGHAVRRAGDNGTAVGVTNQNSGATLQREKHTRHGDIFRERGERYLRRRYVQALGLQQGDDLASGRPVRPGAMYEHYIEIVFHRFSPC